MAFWGVAAALPSADRPPRPAVIISRQQRRVQLMRIKQREDRKEKKKKRRPHHPPPHQHKAHPPEPAYRRKPNPVRRFDGDVLSPVSPAPRVEISPGLGRPFLLRAGGLGRRGRGARVPGGVRAAGRPRGPGACAWLGALGLGAGRAQGGLGWHGMERAGSRAP